MHCKRPTAVIWKNFDYTSRGFVKSINIFADGTNCFCEVCSTLDIWICSLCTDVGGIDNWGRWNQWLKDSRNRRDLINEFSCQRLEFLGQFKSKLQSVQEINKAILKQHFYKKQLKQMLKLNDNSLWKCINGEIEVIHN